MNSIISYNTKIQSGEIIACKKIKQVYARLVDDIENPKEPWIFDQQKADHAVVFIERYCKHSKGKMGGKPLILELWQKALIEAVFGFVDAETGLRKYDEVLLVVGRKNGKALALDTDIPTPHGWKKMIDVNIGDMVFGADGKPHTVSNVSDIFIDHNCYRVTFEDGSYIICDEDHLWTVKTKKGKVIDSKTSELLHFKRERKDGKGTEYLYRVPMNQPVEYESKELPIDPYTFGVWLGDGASANTRITCGKQDLEEMNGLLMGQGHTTKIYDYSDKGKAYIIGVDMVGKAKPNPMKGALRDLGVINNKHIPDMYLLSSVEQRMELLRGLMDTDGYCSKKGQCEFAQKDYNFTLQFSELLSSLGIKNSIRKKHINCNGKQCTAYSVLFFVDKGHSVFKLTRKHDRLKEKLNKRMEWKSITNISPVDSVPCKCISIDSADHLYLAGKNYTATHNSTLSAAVGLYLMLADGEPGAEVYVAATKKDQAKIIWLEAKRMVIKMSSASRAWKKRVKTLVGEIVGINDFEGCSFRPLGADSERLDGLNVHGALMDEIHAWSASGGLELYNVIVDGRDAREQPLTFITTTAGFVREGLYDKKHDYSEFYLDRLEGYDDPGFLPIIYELDDKNEVWDSECWVKANPGLGTIKDKSKLARKVESAKVTKATGNLLTKDFNIPQKPVEGWLDYHSIVNKTVADMAYLSNSYAIGGCDLSATTDLTCATLLIRKKDDVNFYVLQRYFIPESKLEAVDTGDNHNKRNEAPYRHWEEQDWLTVCPGSKVDYSAVTQWFVDMMEKHNIRPLWVCYDAALSGYWVPDMEEHGFDMQTIRQGPITWTYPMKEMGGTFEEHKVVYQNNPILLWCLNNTGKRSTNKDGIESIQPVKLAETRRIDGTVSLLNAWVGYNKFYEEYMHYVQNTRM